MIERRKPRIGCLFMGCRRFREMGRDTGRGTYHRRISEAGTALTELLAADTECVYPGIVYGQADLDTAFSLFGEKEIDCVLSVFMSWAEDEIWIRFLRRNERYPLIIYRPTLNGIRFQDCSREDDFVQFLASGGLVGSLVGSGSVQRLGKKAEVIVGPMEESAAAIVSRARMCMARSMLFGSRFGLMASYNEVMWNTYVDPYALFANGPALTFPSYAELEAAAEEIPDEPLRAARESLRTRYTVDGDVEEEKFTASVRYSLAMGRVMEQKEIDVLAFNDADYRLFETTGLRPGFYPDPPSGNLSLIVPEGDLGGAYIGAILKFATGERVNFVEPFYVDSASGTFAAGHAGPNDYTTVEPSQVRIAVDARFARTSYRYAGAPFAWLRFPPGSMTMAGLSECAGRYKIICGKIECLAGEHFINGYSHSVFRPLDMRAEEFFRKILTIGSTHHFIITGGDLCDDLSYFARIADFDFYQINGYPISQKGASQ